MRNYTLEKKLCDAIARHRIVRLRYKNQTHWRTFEPYVIYRSTKDNILVAGWQTKDESDLSKKPVWHNFEVELISAFEMTDKIFNFDVEFNFANPIYKNGVVCIIKRVKVTD